MKGNPFCIAESPSLESWQCHLQTGKRDLPPIDFARPPPNDLLSLPLLCLMPISFSLVVQFQRHLQLRADGIHGLCLSESIGYLYIFGSDSLRRGSNRKRSVLHRRVAVAWIVIYRCHLQWEKGTSRPHDLLPLPLLHLLVSLPLAVQFHN